LVADIHGALERRCRGQIGESNTCVSNRRTHPRNRVGDYDAVGIARKYHALASAGLEGKSPEGVPPLATALLIDVHLHRACAIHDLVNGCAGPIRATAPADENLIPAGRAVNWKWPAD